MIRFVMVSLLLSLLVYMVYAKLFKKARVPNEPRKNNNGQFKKEGESVMVACAKCGTFTETLDSIAVDGKFYCSKECAGVK
jgi:uncharacterized protein